MKLPNAASGVKKIFIAEILQLIAVLLITVGLVISGAAVVAAVSSGKATAGMGGALTGGMAMILGASILPIIGFILNLVGLKQAAKDEPDYMNKAFWCIIITVILTIIAGIMQGVGWKGGAAVFDVISSICEALAIIFCIMGVSEVTQNISRQDVADLGPKVIVIAAIAMFISIIASIVGHAIGGVAVTIASVLMIVAYIVYIVFLAKASSALSHS